MDHNNTLLEDKQRQFAEKLAEKLQSFSWPQGFEDAVAGLIEWFSEEPPAEQDLDILTQVLMVTTPEVCRVDPQAPVRFIRDGLSIHRNKKLDDIIRRNKLEYDPTSLLVEALFRIIRGERVLERGTKLRGEDNIPECVKAEGEEVSEEDRRWRRGTLLKHTYAAPERWWFEGKNGQSPKAYLAGAVVREAQRLARDLAKQDSLWGRLRVDSAARADEKLPTVVDYVDYFAVAEDGTLTGFPEMLDIEAISEKMEATEAEREALASFKKDLKTTDAKRQELEDLKFDEAARAEYYRSARYKKPKINISPQRLPLAPGTGHHPFGLDRLDAKRAIDLARLHPQQRRVALAMLRGLENSEIAEETGIAPSTVRRHWQEAEKRLRAVSGTSALTPERRYKEKRQRLESVVLGSLVDPPPPVLRDYPCITLKELERKPAPNFFIKYINVGRVASFEKFSKKVKSD